jgi:hypothetical protein
MKNMTVVYIWHATILRWDLGQQDAGYCRKVTCRYNKNTCTQNTFSGYERTSSIVVTATTSTPLLYITYRTLQCIQPRHSCLPIPVRIWLSWWCWSLLLFAVATVLVFVVTVVTLMLFLFVFGEWQQQIRSHVGLGTNSTQILRM